MENRWENKTRDFKLWISNQINFLFHPKKIFTETGRPVWRLLAEKVPPVFGKTLYPCDESARKIIVVLETVDFQAATLMAAGSGIQPLYAHWQDLGAKGLTFSGIGVAT